MVPIALRRLLRAAVLATALACVGWIEGLPPRDPLVQVALGALGLVLAASILVPARRLVPPLQLGLLATELVALGSIGINLSDAAALGADVRLPWFSGYLVAALVSVVGARPGAAILGVLAGLLVLATTMAFGVPAATLPAPAPLLAVIALLVAACLHTASVAGGLRDAARAREFNRQVEREMRIREASAGELVSFTMALADCHTLAEVAEAVMRHLRGREELEVRALVLESEGEEVALWEEPGRLLPEQVEQRRMRLQTSLARAGSSAIVRQLHCRSTSVQPAASPTDLRAAVDIPLRVGGRLAGVLLIAGGGDGRLPPDRVGVLVDVARRTSESIARLERLRDHEHRRTALLLRQMREGVLLLGHDGAVQLANPAARRVLHACAAEDGDPEKAPRIGELTLEELSRTPPGVARRFRATIREAGRDHPSQLACSALSVMDRGRRIGTLVTLADVTDEELSRGRIVQAEKMTLVGQTLAGVAHELNNPLAALIGYADLLGTMKIPVELQKPVQQMKEQALRSTRIVRNLLNFARRRNPERVPVNLAELIHGTVELFAYEARMAEVEIRVDVAEGLPPVLADKHAIQQILVNLVQNALHALGAWSGDRVLAIRASVGADGLQISVGDTGPGVPEELRNRIFESFFTTKGPTKGTGLGLALSRSIAQEHGGDLILAPDVGSGASFTLRLPLLDVARRRNVLAPVQDAEKPAVLPRSILVVDDEASVRETLVAQLGTLGSRVDSASSAAEAERMVTEQRYDALVVDIRMPGSSGLDLHGSLVEKHPFLADRVVFMTGDFVNDDLLQHALATGRILLEKPFTMKELVTALGRTTGELPSAPVGHTITS
jgi:signal transduction histidine kinase/ActR/RegA family two-component response regulator